MRSISRDSWWPSRNCFGSFDSAKMEKQPIRAPRGDGCPPKKPFFGQLTKQINSLGFWLRACSPFNLCVACCIGKKLAWPVEVGKMILAADHLSSSSFVPNVSILWESALNSKYAGAKACCKSGANAKNVLNCKAARPGFKLCQNMLNKSDWQILPASVVNPAFLIRFDPPGLSPALTCCCCRANSPNNRLHMLNIHF